jgi:hypothetical protein
VKSGGGPTWPAPWKHQIHTAGGGHDTADGFRKILFALWLFHKRRPQDLPRLLLHGSPMLGRLNAQPSLQRIIQTPYGNASHAINDSIAITARTTYENRTATVRESRCLTGSAHPRTPNANLRR